MCHCLSMQTRRAINEDAHASDHTSNRVRPWMLTLSNCVKPYLTSCRVIPYHQLTCPAFCSRNKHHGPMPGLCGESGGGPAAPPPGASPRRPEGNAAVWGGGAWGQSLQSGPEQAFQGLPPPQNTLLYRNKCNVPDGSRIHIMVSIRR